MDSSLVQYSSDTIAENIRLGKFINVQPITKKRSAIWTYLNEVFDPETKTQVKGFVVCTICKKVIRYNSKSLGTNHISNHLKTHADGRYHSMDEFVKKRRELTRADKTDVLNASVKFICTDLRPYNAILGDDLANLLQVFMKLGAIYGSLELDQIKEILPSPQTISRHADTDGAELKTKFYADLKNVLHLEGTLPLTVDIWQDKFKRVSYLGMTAHYTELQ